MTRAEELVLDAIREARREVSVDWLKALGAQMRVVRRLVDAGLLVSVRYANGEHFRLP